MVNREDLMECIYQINTLRNIDTKITIPIYDDINGIINKLKNNTAPEPDNITAELIKNRGNTLKRRIYKRVLNI
jgi:hypothetical protein